MRQMPPQAVASLLAAQTSEAYIVLLDITLGDGSVVKLSSDACDTVIGAPPAPEGDFWETESGDLWEIEESTDLWELESSPAAKQVEGTYISFPFELTLPADREGQITSASLSVSNVSQSLIDNIRQQSVPLKVDITVILASDQSVMASYTDFTWRSLTYDIMSISGQLTLEQVLNEPYPQHRMTGVITPGLF